MDAPIILLKSVLCFMSELKQHGITYKQNKMCFGDWYTLRDIICPDRPSDPWQIMY